MVNVLHKRATEKRNIVVQCVQYAQLRSDAVTPIFKLLYIRIPLFFHRQKMLNRLKLYFTPYTLQDDYFISVLKAHNLNPDGEYNKKIHRISMLECVLQIFTELANVSKDNSLNQQIESYKNDIAALKAKEI